LFFSVVFVFIATVATAATIDVVVATVAVVVVIRLGTGKRGRWRDVLDIMTHHLNDSISLSL
jgi:hypothetical protein